MKRQMKKTILATVILVILVISQTVSAAPLDLSQNVYDNFDDNTTDPSLWLIHLKDSGPTVSEINQRLEFTLPADSAGDDFAAWYDSVCQLRGDYDIQVDYELLTWPLASGARIGLTDNHANMHRVSSGTQPNDYPGGPDFYMTLFATAGYWSTEGITPTSDLSGKLRLQRVGDTINTFYFANGSWVLDASNSDPAYPADTPFALGAWSADSVFTDQEVKVAFDNLIINQGELVCPPTNVMIEIRPDGVANRINPRAKGLLPVAILTTNNFAAETVETSTVLFGPSGTEAAPVDSVLEDVDSDGDTDLLLYFNLRNTGIRCGDMDASLVGETKSGRAVAGSDNFVTVGCKDR